MSDSAISAALAAFVAGILGSLRPLLMLGIYRVCRLAPPRSGLRRILRGGPGYYYGWIAIALYIWLFFFAAHP